MVMYRRARNASLAALGLLFSGCAAQTGGPTRAGDQSPQGQGYPNKRIETPVPGTVQDSHGNYMGRGSNIGDNEVRVQSPHIVPVPENIRSRGGLAASITGMVSFAPANAIVTQDYALIQDTVAYERFAASIGRDVAFIATPEWISYIANNPNYGPALAARIKPGQLMLAVETAHVHAASSSAHEPIRDEKSNAIFGLTGAKLLKTSDGHYRHALLNVQTITVVEEPQDGRSVPSADGKILFTVFFDHDRSDLTPQAQTTLRAAIAAGRSGGTPVQLFIDAYTDRSGTKRYNQGLSQRRADAVKKFLVDNGHPQNLLSSRAFGENCAGGPDGVRNPEYRRANIRGAQGAECSLR